MACSPSCFITEYSLATLSRSAPFDPGHVVSPIAHIYMNKTRQHTTAKYAIADPQRVYSPVMNQPQKKIQQIPTLMLLGDNAASPGTLNTPLLQNQTRLFHS